MKRLSLAIIGLLVLVSGCQKEKPIVIAEWETYQDPYFKCSFNYPKGWSPSSEAARVTVYSSKEGAQKFFDPTSKSPDASQVIVAYEKAGAQSIEALLNSYLSELKTSGFTVESTTPKTFNGLPAFEVAYKGTFESGVKLSATRRITVKDSILFSASYAGFNAAYIQYRSAYDTLLASLHLPEARSAAKHVDPAMPSQDFLTFKNRILEISHPSNFEAEFPQPKGDIAFSMELKGYRNDCTIRIDAFSAKGLTAEKVFKQNEKFFKKTSKGETTIDGTKTPFLNYTPTKGIESRVYFLVKKDTVYRVITNYYQPMKKDFLPAFEKTVASIRIH